jgi:small subunit ribosomal protein S17
MATATEPGKRRGEGGSKVGVVVSDKMDKTVIVRVDRTVNHRAYRRYVRRSAKFMAHDETNACKIGDTVEIVEARPLSARKRWRVRKVVRAAIAGMHEAGEAGEAGRGSSS